MSEHVLSNTPGRPGPSRSRPDDSPPAGHESTATLPTTTGLLMLLALALFALWWFGVHREAAQPAPRAVSTGIQGQTGSGAAGTDAGMRAATPSHHARGGNAGSGKATAITRPPQPISGQDPAPQYPLDALRSGTGGEVVVRVQVGADGRPIDASLLRRSSSRELDRAALQAVRQWKFRPALREGRAVASTVDVPVEFSPRG